MLQSDTPASLAQVARSRLEPSWNPATQQLDHYLYKDANRGRSGSTLSRARRPDDGEDFAAYAPSERARS